MWRTIMTLNLNRRCRTKQPKRLSECFYTYSWNNKLCTKFTNLQFTVCENVHLSIRHKRDVSIQYVKMYTCQYVTRGMCRYSMWKCTLVNTSHGGCVDIVCENEHLLILVNTSQEGCVDITNSTQATSSSAYIEIQHIIDMYMMK